jgi:hypothetical protein
MREYSTSKATRKRKIALVSIAALAITLVGGQALANITSVPGIQFYYLLTGGKNGGTRFLGTVQNSTYPGQGINNTGTLQRVSGQLEFWTGKDVQINVWCGSTSTTFTAELTWGDGTTNGPTGKSWVGSSKTCTSGSQRWQTLDLGTPPTPMGEGWGPAALMVVGSLEANGVIGLAWQ